MFLSVLGVLLLVGSTPAGAASTSWVQLGGDIAGTEAADQSGYAVSMDADGSRLAIGAPLHDGGRGTVRVYDWNGTSWDQVGEDIDGAAAGDMFGFSVSLSSDGSRVAIGALHNDGTTGVPTDDRGHVRVYDWNGSAWAQVGADIEGSAGEDYAGVSASLSSDGSRVAFGAQQPGGSGYVRVFQLSGTTWTQVHSDIRGETNGDLSGRSVSLSSNGTRVAIGAVHNDGNGDKSGNVRIFEATGSGWEQMGGDIDGEAASDETGQSVSLSSDGTRVAVGAPLHDGGRGTVRVYDWNGTSWDQVADDIDGEAAGDMFGISVSLSSDGSRVAIGAHLNDGTTGVPTDDRGHVRVYDWNGTSWDQVADDIDGEAAGDHAGVSVSLSRDGSRVAFGADLNDDAGINSGHVRVSESSCSPSTTSYTSGSTDYTVVTFNNVGVCNWTVPAGVTSVDVLAVGGGGGGGAHVGGGGGGGGVNYSPNITVTPNESIPVTVGAGGAGATWSGGTGTFTSGANGASSSFGSAVSALGGGVGASNTHQVAGTGSSVASGGGGSRLGAYVGGTGATSSGGSPTSDLPHAAGGGGGAGGGGNDGTEDDGDGTGGAGGPGGISDITGTSIYYGGGGGGGVHGAYNSDKSGVLPGSVGGHGGLGGGGRGRAGEELADGGAGEDGLGGGGGGDANHSATASAGGAGGSGVVIVRYTLAMATCSPETTSYTSGSTEYTVVAFKDVGTCSWTIPSGVSKFDWLVVGGGGGGGSWHGGGGGAGGLRQSAGLNVPLDTSFTIQVGAGGAGAPAAPPAEQGSSGQASGITGSSSGSLVAVLGGGGGGSGSSVGTDGNDGAAGGSGGGAQAALTYGGTVGAGTSGEGNDGGTGAGGGVSHPGTAWVAGGGGGAGGTGGGAGEALGDVRAGNGGAGAASSWLTTSAATALGVGEVSGSDVYFAGGGAGSGEEAVTYTLGVGGVGGGGDGRLLADGSGEDGAASTGGGGAGTSYDEGTLAGGAGGSGVVVLRYARTVPATLTYDLQGGTGGPADQSGSPTSTVTVSSTVPTRGGYTFGGWDTQADGTGTAYSAGDPYTLPSAGATDTLYAQWRVVEVVEPSPPPTEEGPTAPETPAPPSPPSSSPPADATDPSEVATPADAPEAPAPEPEPEPLTPLPAPTELADLPDERLVTSDETVPGETLMVQAGGFEPDEPVEVYAVTGDTVDPLTSTDADGDGAVVVEVEVPVDACGDLTLVVWAPGSGVGLRQDLTVTACASETPEEPTITEPGVVDVRISGGPAAWSVLPVVLGAFLMLLIIGVRARVRRGGDEVIV